MKNRGFPNRFLYIFLLGLLLMPSGLMAQVNRSELDNLGPVEFISYEGPHARIETRAQIRSIGYSLGQIVRAGTERTGGLGRYFVIHSVSDEDGSKLDADIMGLGADVGVDHIRNLRLIIQGYLEAAYEYVERDAALLAEYITIYNAVYRGDWAYFSSRYKTPVMDNLTRERVGLSIRYDEWPGQTLIVIPLGTGLGGGLSSIDTAAVSDSRVIEQLRQEPDMGIDQRKDMVDLMEREADQAAQEAEIRREAIRQEEERIARERQQTQQQQQQAQQQQQQAQQQQQQITQERQQPGADQQELDRRQEAARQQEETARQQEEAAIEKQEELDKIAEELKAEEEEVEKLEEFAEERITQAQEERQQIAIDQQTLIGQDGAGPRDGLLGISIQSESSALGRLVLLDSSGSVNRQSPLNTINARTVSLISNRIFAIAGEERASGAIRLIELNSSTLEMLKQGEDNISAGSLLWVRGQDLYAITNSGGALNLARFNTDLILQARSAISVHPYASVVFIDNYLATQRSDGSAAVLNPMTLTEGM